jgi:DNA polymerase-1
VRLTPFTDPPADPADPADPPPRSQVVADGELAEVAAGLERQHPRWVWSDSARWYPLLLAAGVRIERCVDLRLAHAILRHSALTAASAIATSPADDWDTAPRLDALPLTPAPTAPDHATLFDSLDDPGLALPGGSTHPDPASAPGGGDSARNPASAAALARARMANSDRATPSAQVPGAAAAAGSPRATTPVDEASDPDAIHESDGWMHAADPSDATAPPPELTEWLRQREAIRTAADPSRIALLVAAESAGSLVAAEMQHAGIPWSAPQHDRLLTDLLGPRPAAPGIRPARLEALLERIRHELGDPGANPDSPAELVKSLRRAGLSVTSTRSWELKNIDHPAIPPLLEYKKLSRLLTANGWNWVDTWVRDGRFHPNYIPGGVVTGRWASEGGGALQLPKLVRSAVIADPGWTLVVADAAQLEPRILAALAGDRAMAAAGRGRDLYDGIVASGAVDTRAHAKLGMLGAMYGGTTGESGRMLPRLARAYPNAIKFVEDAARAGEAGAVVTTRLGRTSPRPSDDWLDVQDAAGADGATEAARSGARTAARSWGRFTRNFVVQGTAAEWALCWIGAIRRRLWQLGPASDAATTARIPDARLEQRPHLAFFLHDEVMVHTPAHLAEAVADELRSAAVEAGRLIFGEAPVDFPVTVAVVDSYDQAK